MNEQLQPYLKGLSPSEIPFRGSEHLKVTKEYGDYNVNLTEAGILRACTRQSLSDAYKSISTIVQSDESTQEALVLSATRDSLILWDGFHHRDMVIEKDEDGLSVFIYTPRLGALLNGSLSYLMTRYDINANKIWIRKQ